MDDDGDQPAPDNENPTATRDATFWKIPRRAWILLFGVLLGVGITIGVAELIAESSGNGLGIVGWESTPEDEKLQIGQVWLRIREIDKKYHSTQWGYYSESTVDEKSALSGAAAQAYADLLPDVIEIVQRDSTRTLIANIEGYVEGRIRQWELASRFWKTDVFFGLAGTIDAGWHTTFRAAESLSYQRHDEAFFALSNVNRLLHTVIFQLANLNIVS